MAIADGRHHARRAEPPNTPDRAGGPALPGERVAHRGTANGLTLRFRSRAGNEPSGCWPDPDDRPRCDDHRRQQLQVRRGLGRSGGYQPADRHCGRAVPSDVLVIDLGFEDQLRGVPFSQTSTNIAMMVRTLNALKVFLLSAARQCHTVVATLLVGEGVAGGASGVALGETNRVIGERIGRDHTIVWREQRQNIKAGKGYRAVAADSAARARRRRPQTRKVDADPVLLARVVKDLSRSRTPRQIAGRLRLEAAEPTVELMNNSLPAQGRVVSHEPIYTWIYALPKGELAKSAIMLRSKRTRRVKRKALGARTGGRIVGRSASTTEPPTSPTAGCLGTGRATACATRRCVTERR